jgi:hypothetical protein
MFFCVIIHGNLTEMKEVENAQTQKKYEEEENINPNPKNQ